MNTNKKNKEKIVVKEKNKMQKKKSFQTHIRHSERDRAREGEMKNGRQ
jgi:hypothetical protein